MATKKEAFVTNGAIIINDREGWWGEHSNTGELYVCLREDEFNNGVSRRVRRLGRGKGSVDTQFWNVLNSYKSKGISKAKAILFTENNGSFDYNPDPIDVDFIAINDSRFVVEVIN